MAIPENIQESEIHTFLNRRLGEKEADEVMEYIKREVDRRVSERVDHAKKEISLWREDMKDIFATREDAAILQNKLVKRVSSAEGTLILWQFVFWITLIVAVFCIFKFVE